MANEISADGLTIDSLNTVKNKLTNYFTQIYGSINIEQNSPDAQLLNIFAQMIEDNLELLQDINASFDPDQAVGTILDSRVKLNGLTRKPGEYTTCYVSVSFTGSETLKGIDLYDIDECFQVSDSTGNILVPVTTTSGVGGDTLNVLFRAAEYGALKFESGTITQIKTPLAGVSSVTNAEDEIYVGALEETDDNLRMRRMIAASSVGNYGGIDALKTAIAKIDGVTFVDIAENNGEESESYYNQIPQNGIWIVVEGGASNEEIAKAIYAKRIAGTPMKGSVSYTLYPENSPRPFVAKWDNAVEVSLYVEITCRILNAEFSADAIKSAIDAIKFEVGEMADVTTITAKLKEEIPSIIISSLQISTDNVSFGNYIIPNFNERLYFSKENIFVTAG